MKEEVSVPSRTSSSGDSLMRWRVRFPQRTLLGDTNPPRSMTGVFPADSVEGFEEGTMRGRITVVAALLSMTLLLSCSSGASEADDVGRAASIYRAVIQDWGLANRHGLVVDEVCDGAAEASHDGGCEPMSGQ